MESTNTVKEKDKKEPMTPKQRTIFILKIVGNVVFYGVILALFLFSIMNINAGRKHGIPNIFGRGYLVVLTDSMDAEESRLPAKYKEYNIKQFKGYQKATDTSPEYSGDLLNVKMLNRGDIDNLKVGDVITYWDDGIEVSDGTKGAFNTHRITYVHKNENNKVDVIYTVGDRDIVRYGWKDVESMTPSEINDYENETYLDVFSESNFGNIKAIVTSVNYNGAGLVNFVQNNWLFIFIIPISIILVIEVILVVKNIFDLRREKNKAIDLADHEAQMAELQSEKERMRQELLAELRAQGAIPQEEPKQEAPAEEKVEEAKVAPAVEEKAPVEETKVEETPAEDEKTEEVEEVKEENTEEIPVEEKEEEKEPVVNDEALEPDMDIEENEEEK